MRLLTGLFLLLVSGGSFAGSCQEHGESSMWFGDRLVGADMTWNDCISSSLASRVGLAHYDDFGLKVTGATIGLRLQRGDVVAPFAGVGALVGLAERRFAAAGDSLDNDGDGTVDEANEMDYDEDFESFVYPEVGLMLQAGDASLTLSARRHFGSDYSGEMLYGIAVRVPFFRGD